MSSKEILKKYLRKKPKPFFSILENGDKADYFEGLDIEKPEALTPMDMELRIQADRVMFSLNKASSVLSVLAQFPLLLENDGQVLRENFTASELDFIAYVLRLYDDSFYPKLDDNVASGELYDTINKIKLSKGIGRLRASDAEVLIDANLSQVIHMIFTNKCIRQIIKHDENPITVPFIMQFLKDFEELKAMAKIKLYVTGTEEDKRDKRLRQAYKSNVMLIAAIEDLEQQLETQREQLGNELNEKVEIFERYNNKIANIREEFQMSIEKNIHESERKMMQQCIESEEKQAVLAVEAETITQQFEILMADHISDEKGSRAKTLKTESQLTNWLSKYDVDIGEKQNEYEELKRQYDAEKDTMEDLEEKLEEQERIYHTLMVEKEEEEQRLYEEIAWKLLTNRSARIIQRAYRAYRERKLKRKGKKGKKGKEGKKSQGKK